MWSRRDLKMRGSIAFQRNYWSSVAVSLIAAIAYRGTGYGSSYVTQVRDNLQFTNNDYDFGYARGFFNNMGNAIFALMFSIIFIIISLIFILLKIFIGNLLIVGGNRFFMENREHETPISRMFYAFKSKKFGNIVLTMFLRDLFTFFWSCLLVVPGIIKSYEYRMIPYLLSENPDMNRTQAFAISKQMMYGQKMDVFLLDLSFIGWSILSMFTCKIVGVFYFGPYLQATCAELYAVLRVHAFQSGFATTYDLPGYGMEY